MYIISFSQTWHETRERAKSDETVAIIQKCEIFAITKGENPFQFFFLWLILNFNTPWAFVCCWFFVVQCLYFLPCLSFSSSTYYNYNYLLIKCDRLPYLLTLTLTLPLYTLANNHTHTIESKIIASRSLVICHLIFLFSLRSLSNEVCVCVVMSSANGERDRERVE